MQVERTTYYLLGYQPTNTATDGRFRKISVRVTRGKYTVRARPGYIAPRSLQSFCSPCRYSAEPGLTPPSPWTTSTMMAAVWSEMAASAESGADAWLRYSSVKPGASSLPGLVAAVGKGEMVRTAGRELVRALAGKPANQGPVGALPNANAFVLGNGKTSTHFFRS